MGDLSMAHPAALEGRALHGRAAELTELTAVWRRADAGGGSAFVVEGLASIGKSALVHAAVVDAARADEGARDVPDPAPWTLAVHARRGEAALPFAALHALMAPVVERAGAAVGRRLAAALAGDAVADAELLGVGVDLLGLFTAVARDAAVLCWVDDAQWLDARSAEVLSFVAARLGGHRIAMVVTQRPGGPFRDLPTLQLGPIDEAAALAVLGDLRPTGVPGDVAAGLVETAAGNPGVLVDLAASLTEAQWLGDAPTPDSLPPSSALRRDYVEQLRRLPAPTRRLLMLAGADRELDVAELVGAAKAARIDVRALEPAERAGLIATTQDSLTAPIPVLRRVAYDEATVASRRAAHMVLQRVISATRHPARHHLQRAALAVGPDDEVAEALARAAALTHNRALASRALDRAAALSTEPATAAVRLVASARAAWDGGAPHRARTLLRQVALTDLTPAARAECELLLGEIELRSGVATRAGHALRAVGDDPRQDRSRRIAALLQAGEALCQSGDYPDFAQLASKALTLWENGPGGPAGPDEPLVLQLAFEQFSGLTAMFRGDHLTGGPALRRVIALATALDEAGALIRGSMAAIVVGDDVTAYRLAVRAASQARAVGHHAVVPQALELAAAAECALGRYDQAAQTLTEAMPLARSTGQENLHDSLVALRAVLAAIVGDRPAAIAHIGLVRADGGDRAQALVAWAQGILELVGGQPADAVVRLRGLLSPESGHGQLIIAVAAAPHLIEATVRIGDLTAASMVFGPFDGWAQSTANPAWLALADRCRALLAGDPEEAVRHFQSALAHHHTAQAEFERARTELLFGQELRRARAPSAAREHLRAALEVFQRYRAGPLIDQAAAELRAAGEHVGPESPAHDAASALTAQQLQIARLAAGGATNREVAAALVISPRTVDYHMRNILTRLGVRSRVDLAKLLR